MTVGYARDGTPAYATVDDYLDALAQDAQDAVYMAGLHGRFLARARSMARRRTPPQLEARRQFLRSMPTVASAWPCGFFRRTGPTVGYDRHGRPAFPTVHDYLEDLARVSARQRRERR